MRKWTGQPDNHAITSDLRLALDVENRIRVAARRQIDECSRDVVTIVAEVKRAAGGRDSSRDRRIVYWSIQLKRNRSDQVGEIVSYHERISSFNSQGSK